MVFPSTIIVARQPLPSLNDLITTLQLGHLDNNPDILQIGQETTPTIAEIRSLNHFLSQKPFAHQNKLAIIYQANTLNLESQNALLKNLEEPGEFNYLVLITTNLSHLLPTVISRCQIIKTKNTPASLPPPLQITSNPKTNLFLADQIPKNEILPILEAEACHLHSLLLKDNSSQLSTKITALFTAIDMVEHNVDPKSALDYYLLASISQ